jgi:hypothetical protein
MSLSLSRSPLRRALAELAPSSGAVLAADGVDIAERLARMLSFSDSLALYAALNSGAQTSETTAAQAVSGDAVQALAHDIASTRAALETGIREGWAHSSGSTGQSLRVRLPQPDPAMPLEICADYTPYLRYYFAQQRAMESQAQRLRSAARADLSQAGSSQRALVALDVTLHEALAERERTALASVPLRIEARFIALRDEHLAQAGRVDAADDVTRWTQPNGWLTRFTHFQREVLYAELDLRWHALRGLLAALTPKTAQTPLLS